MSLQARQRCVGGWLPCGVVADGASCAHPPMHAGPALHAALSAAGCELLEVHSKSQAADVQLTTHASEFATSHRRQGCLVVVTCDTGVCGEGAALKLA